MLWDPCSFLEREVLEQFSNYDTTRKWSSSSKQDGRCITDSQLNYRVMLVNHGLTRVNRRIFTEALLYFRCLNFKISHTTHLYNQLEKKLLLLWFNICLCIINIKFLFFYRNNYKMLIVFVLTQIKFCWVCSFAQRIFYSWNKKLQIMAT
jgi:hypothetical protein